MADMADLAFPSTVAKVGARFTRQTRLFVLFAVVVATAAPMSFGTASAAAAPSPQVDPQVVINFDDLSNGDVVTSQYPSATFSSTGTNVNYVTAQPGYNGSKPNFLCTGPGPSGGTINCAQETIIDFTSAVNGLTFNGLGIDDTGTVADIDVFGASGLLATVPVIGNASGIDPELQDLSAYSDITQIRIYNITDNGGAGWDDFTFTPTVADTTPPSCVLTAVGFANGHTFIKVTVQDAAPGSGLQSIVVTDHLNATVVVPAFTVGTNNPIVVKATKINQNSLSRLALRVTDVAGNVTNCDPVIATPVGPVSSQLITNVPTAEHVLTVINGSPGLRTLTATVNGKKFAVNSLRAGQTRTVDIGSAMRPGDANTVKLAGAGPAGSSATVVIWDGIGSIDGA